MAQWSSVHLMFCEGPHDAAFLNRLLKKQLGFAQIGLKLSELPYPLANVFQQSFKTRVAEDMRLDLAKKFFLPDFMVERGRALVMVFNYGGANRRGNLAPFLENFFSLLAAPAFAGMGLSTELPKYSYILFADADAHGQASARAQISTDLATIGESAWLGATWTDYKDTKAATQDTGFGPTASYIWKKWTEDHGTLEDIVLDCLSGGEGLEQTLSYLDTRFDWKPTSPQPKDVCASAARRLKAAFSVEGQREKPGGSLSVVLDQGNVLTAEALQKSPAVQDCVLFLSEWLASVPPSAAITGAVFGS
jgi:hypothetical protein